MLNNIVKTVKKWYRDWDNQKSTDEQAFEELISVHTKDDNNLRKELDERLDHILKWNSYTYMGGEYNFDYLCELVLGDDCGKQRDVNLEAIKGVTKFMNNEQLKDILDKMDLQRDKTINYRENQF